MKYTVLGGGSWATAIVKILSENLPEITWYMRNELAISHIKKYKHNPNYLSSVELRTDKIHLTSNINEAVEWADYVIFVIPSAFLVTELSKLTVPLKDKVIFSAIKGIVPDQPNEYRGYHWSLPCRRSGARTPLLPHCGLRRSPQG